MNNIKFVAFDVETAASRNPRFICQLGLSIVNTDNEIETKSFLIQPPGNKIESRLSGIHGITSEDTLYAPDFESVWTDIKHLFSHTLVAHNSSFDCSVLIENLEYYDLEIPNLTDCNCTYKIFNRKLDELCDGFNIDCSSHHDAGFDAKCCAQFFINHLNGIEPNEDLMPEAKIKSPKLPKSTAHKLKGDILVKDLTNANPDNPFYDKKTVITGTFLLERKDLAVKIKDLGADINTSISKQTDIVLMGDNAGPSKLNKIKSLNESGCNIKVIQEVELLEIFDMYF